MRIVMASPEAVPYIKTGGLADVAGSLCKEFRKTGNDARIILPLYRQIRESGIQLTDTDITIRVPVGRKHIEGKLYTDRASQYFISHDGFFDRQELYGNPAGDYPDNAARFVFFSRGILEACRVLKFKPDIIHCNDWQTGLLPLYLKKMYSADAFFRKTATVFTIHNIGYQGLFPAAEMATTHFGPELFHPDGIEFYGKVNFLKGGIISADLLTTVSRSYAEEILTREYGFGLDGILKTRAPDLYGVVNGIDYEEWDPSKDACLPSRYSARDISGKQICKKKLLKTLFNSSDDRVPLIGIVGRLSDQKGLDLVIESIPALLSFGVKIALLGKGDEKFHREFRQLAEKYSKMISVTIGFDDTLAHRIYAGSDIFLMPSRYEPCGLGQLIALRYGSLPVARRTGGLRDTIADFEPLASKGTGFLFSDYTPSAMQESVKRALCVYTDREKREKMITEGMQSDFSWAASARRYLELYQAALKKKKG